MVDVPAQQGLLGLGRALQQFAPDRRGDGFVQPVASGGYADVVEYEGDPFRIANAIRIPFEAGDLHDFALPRGHEPHQSGVDPVDPGAPRGQFVGAHSAARAPAARAPAAPCR